MVEASLYSLAKQEPPPPSKVKAQDFRDKLVSQSAPRLKVALRESSIIIMAAAGRRQLDRLPLQAAGDLAERGAEIGADCSHHHHCGDGNQCRDQAVLDGRDTFLIFDQAQQGLHASHHQFSYRGLGGEIWTADIAELLKFGA